MPTELETGKLFIADSDGNMIPFVEIKNIDAIAGIPENEEKYAQFKFEPVECSFEIKTRICKGLFDIVFGRSWTKSAQRYTRWIKRQKEKERRNKLKHKGG